MMGGELEEARRHVEDLLALRPKIRGPQAVEQLRAALESAQRQWALFLLLVVDIAVVKQLIPELAVASFRDRDALLAREILGRLPRSDSTQLVGPHFATRLGAADDHELRRMAETMKHLGLDSELGHLIRFAKESSDPAIREVADDFDV